VPEAGYALTEDAAKQLQRLWREHRQLYDVLRRQTAAIKRVQAQMPAQWAQWLEVTSVTLDAHAEAYPGRLLTYDPLADEFANFTAVWVRFPGEVQPAVNAVYRGWLESVEGDGDLSIYLVFGPASGMDGLLVRDVDGSPSQAAQILEVNQASGIYVSATFVEGDLVGATLTLAEASATGWGVVSPNPQTWAGNKYLTNTSEIGLAAGGTDGDFTLRKRADGRFVIGGNEGDPPILEWDRTNNRLLLDGEAGNAKYAVVEDSAAFNGATGTLTDGTVVKGGLVTSIVDGTRGTATMGSAYTITADDVWEDTGLSITLPSAGTYLLIYAVHGLAALSAGTLARVAARLYNVSDSAAVADSEVACAWWPTAASLQGRNTGGQSMILSVAASKTLRLEAKRDGSGATWAASQIVTCNEGRTKINYVKIAQATS